MTKTEKYLVLNALISEIIYASSEVGKFRMNYSLESGHGKTYSDLYLKLNKQWFKNNSKDYNANLTHFNDKMKEVQ